MRTERRIEAPRKPLLGSTAKLWATALAAGCALLPGVVRAADDAEDAKPSDSPAGKIENVLFLISDDLKLDVLPAYGNEICATPNIDRLAAEGMVFERAYCQGTWCKPSRTSFMRSRYRDKKGLTMGEHFRDQGVFSGRVSKIFHMKVPGDIFDGTDGLDVAECWTEKVNVQAKEALTPGDYALLNKNIFTEEIEGRQHTAMPHRMFVSVKTDGDGSEQPDPQAAEKTVAMLRERAEKPGEPFFLATGFVRPHYPSVAPREYFEPYPYLEMDLPEAVEGDLAEIPKPGRTGLTSANSGIGEFPDNIRRMWSAYYATVTFMDEQLGKVLDELDRLGLRESTAIVFTSDHGYLLGEHQFWQKGSLRDEVTRVPLIVSVPGFEPGRSDSLVELVDLYPTFCELLGLPVPESVEGKSLVPVLRDPGAEVKEVATSFTRKGQGWRTSDWAYMRYKNGEEELFDMREDPGQLQNLAGDSAHAADLARMREVAGLAEEE